MGHWSVCCGISNVPIVRGQRCVVLPIRKQKDYSRGDSWISGVLPIYGNYDDYGGLENIEENENTKLIESYFNVSIKDFVNFFTMGSIHIEETLLELRENEEIKNWSYMFIDREVFDYMTTHNPDIQFDKTKLQLLGFESIGKHQYKKQDKVFGLFGNYLYFENSPICDIEPSTIGNKPPLTHYINLTEEEISIAKSSRFQLWRHYERLPPSLNGRGELNDFDFCLLGSFGILPFSFPGIEDLTIPIRSLYAKKVVESDPYFTDELVKLLTLNINLRHMSGSLNPHNPYATIQTGARRECHIILEKFVEINKNYLIKEES